MVAEFADPPMDKADHGPRGLFVSLVEIIENLFRDLRRRASYSEPSYPMALVCLLDDFVRNKFLAVGLLQRLRSAAHSASSMT
jgi:hypothetical protein